MVIYYENDGEKKCTGVTSQWTSTLSTCNHKQSILLQLHEGFW